MWLLDLCPEVGSSRYRARRFGARPQVLCLRFEAQLHPIGELNMPKKRKKTKKDNSSITRRDILKGAGAAGAAAVMGPIMLTSRKAFAFQDPTDGGSITAPPAEPVSCDFGVISPPTRPFIDTLPVPATATKTTLMPRPTKDANRSANEAARAPHQRWEE